MALCDITELGLDSLFFAIQVDIVDKFHLDHLPTFSLEGVSKYLKSSFFAGTGKHPPLTTNHQGGSAKPGGKVKADQETRLCLKARVTASVREATPNLERILLTWDLIVDGLTPN